MLIYSQYKKQELCTVNCTPLWMQVLPRIYWTIVSISWSAFTCQILLCLWTNAVYHSGQQTRCSSVPLKPLALDQIHHTRGFYPNDSPTQFLLILLLHFCLSQLPAIPQQLYLPLFKLKIRNHAHFLQGYLRRATFFQSYHSSIQISAHISTKEAKCRK